MWAGRSPPSIVSDRRIEADHDRTAASSSGPRERLLRCFQSARPDPDGADGRRLPGLAGDRGRQCRWARRLRRAHDAARMRSGPGHRRCGPAATAPSSSTSGFPIRRPSAIPRPRMRSARSWATGGRRSRARRPMRRRWIFGAVRGHAGGRAADRLLHHGALSTRIRRADEGARASSGSRRPPPSPRRGQPKHAGADAIIAQGMEAGGHRGAFDATTRRPAGRACSPCCPPWPMR